MVTVIVPAAGQGKRMGAGKNKILLELNGEPVLVRTLRRFSAVDEVDSLIIAVAPEEVTAISELLSKYPELKSWQIVAGGSERQYSIANGLRVVPPETEIVLVHDAARPLVSQRDIESVIGAAREYGAAVLAVREKNTVKLGQDGFVVRTVPRDNLWEMQTPQGFRRDIITRAYAQAAADNFLGTDDASLAERTGAKIAIVEGDYRNIKLTTSDDLLIAETFMKQEAQ